MKKLLSQLSLVVSLLVSTSAAAHTELSDKAYISLLTCEPSTAIYERFWHSAIRVCDPANGIDKAYNYGIFDFDTPFFTAKFVKGATDYILAVYDTEDFVDSYMARRSTIYEQILNLTADERQTLYDALEENALPENKTYRYNFVYDNCATRVYFIIKKVLDRYGTTMIIDYPFRPTTYRAVFEQFLGRDNWQRFAIDIVIGEPADRQISPDALIAFPKYTMEFVANTQLTTDTLSVPLVASVGTICRFPTVKPSEHSLLRPTFVCSLLMVVVIFLSFWCWRVDKYFAIIDFILFFVFGLIGTVVFYLMFFSVHPLVSPNYNILWANPLMLVFSLLLLNKRWRRYLSYFAIFNALTTIIAIIIFVLRIQVMHASFLALMAMMLVRSLMFFQQNFYKKYQ